MSRKSVAPAVGVCPRSSRAGPRGCGGCLVLVGAGDGSGAGGGELHADVQWRDAWWRHHSARPQASGGAVPPEETHQREEEEEEEKTLFCT